ncbi:unnamed protein product [Protopolystoma xenopodis]|uniref:DUF3385 domain-containing protein n=1 Tax=Protopolystoma xenopodis TaxID=117903 RepID=A0A448WLW2_9PLAT|nr:unnamed protein product [Protopolystoma xenopodis]
MSARIIRGRRTVCRRLFPTNPQSQFQGNPHSTLNELRYSGSTRNKEQSALLLASLIAASPRFFMPYAKPLLHLLLARLRSALPPGLRASLIMASLIRLRSEGSRNMSQSSADQAIQFRANALNAALLAAQATSNCAQAAAQTIATAATHLASGADGIPFLSSWGLPIVPTGIGPRLGLGQAAGATSGVSGGPGIGTELGLSRLGAASQGYAAVPRILTIPSSTGTPPQHG